MFFIQGKNDNSSGSKPADRNTLREERGNKLLMAYAEIVLEVNESRMDKTLIIDMLADVFHFCEREGYDHEALIASAIAHVIEEREGND